MGEDRCAACDGLLDSDVGWLLCHCQPGHFVIRENKPCIRIYSNSTLVEVDWNAFFLAVVASKLRKLHDVGHEIMCDIREKDVNE